jgi:hypothetical protein
LTYFLDDRGFAKATCKMPGRGPTWLTALTTITSDGRERLYGSFVKVEPPLKVYSRGLAVFNDDKQQFEHLADVEMSAPGFPNGHAFKHSEEGVEYIYFAGPYPLTRVRATAESFQRIADYECYTCLKSGSRLDEPQVERDGQGNLVYAWKKDTPAVGPSEQARLIAAGKMKASEALLPLRDRDSGKAVTAHSGSVYWNEHRRRWVMIAVQSGGTSYLGEVWYAEADVPQGPWEYAVKVVTHDRYSFYNPKQHPMFDQQLGRVIFFEGTYTHTFSGNSEPTPRYDYNQVLYKLDLADPRLALPVPVYNTSSDEAPERFSRKKSDFSKKPGLRPRAAFFALDRAASGTVPVMAGDRRLQIGKPGEDGALFHAVAPDAKSPPAATVPLYEYVSGDGARRAYSTNAELSLAGFRRAERPLCWVWR